MELIVGAKKFSDKENLLVITKISIFCAHYEVVKLVLPNRSQVEKTLKAFFYLDLVVVLCPIMDHFKNNYVHKFVVFFTLDYMDTLS